MKNYLILVALLFGACLSMAQKADQAGIEKACMNYLEGFYEGDVDKIKACLQPSLYKFGYWKNKETGQYAPEGQMTFEEAIAYAQRVKDKGKFAKKDAIKKVQILDVSNHIAVAKITAWWGIDYVFLTRQPEKWMIEQVIWEGPLIK